MSQDATEYLFGRCLPIDPRFAVPPGYTTEATMSFGLTSRISAAAAKSVARPMEMKAAEG